MIIRTTVNGREVEFETFKDVASVMGSKAILAGQTYPVLPALGEARTILDVGANAGAATVFFACHFPDATIHAFEPGPETFETLKRNTAGWARIHLHPFGLYDADERRALYRGKVGPGQASIIKGDEVAAESDVVDLRDARSWIEAEGIDRIDILKIDTEGCEVPILESMRSALATVRVLYLEFHSREDWRRIDELLEATHTLGLGRYFFGGGEVVYVRTDLLPLLGQD